MIVSMEESTINLFIQINSILFTDTGLKKSIYVMGKIHFTKDINT